MSPFVFAASSLNHSIILPPQEVLGTSLGLDPSGGPDEQQSFPCQRVKGLENQQLSF